MAEVSTIGIPKFVWTLIWIVIMILLVIFLALLIHHFGGGTFVIRLGHFNMQIGIS
jgi:hypothetical protein